MTATQQESLFPASPPSRIPAPRIDQPAPTVPMRRGVADHLYVEVLSASIASPTTASVTFRIDGAFGNPGSRAEVDAVVVVVSLPAKILPAPTRVPS